MERPSSLRNARARALRALSQVGRWTTVSVMSLTCFGLRPAAAQDFSTLVNTKGSYVRINEPTNSGDAALRTPLIIDLQSLGLGITGGTQLRLSRTGTYSLMGHDPLGPDPGVQSESVYRMTGVFSTTNTLLAENLLNRVPDSLQATNLSDVPLSVVTNPTFYGALATDVPNDFEIGTPGNLLLNFTDVKVPVGARYLFVAPFDDLYRDNGDADRNYRFNLEVLQDVTETNVPEPGALLLFSPGLLALAALRRRRVR